MDVSKKPFGVYDVWLLGRTGGKYDKNLKAKLEKEKMVLSRDYAEEMSECHSTTGRLCVYDEEATKQYYIDGEAKLKARQEAEEIQSSFSNVMADVIKEAKTKQSQSRRGRKPKAESND